jgi:hypothetical protein
VRKTGEIARLGKRSQKDRGRGEVGFGPILLQKSFEFFDEQ